MTANPTLIVLFAAGVLSVPIRGWVSPGAPEIRAGRELRFVSGAEQVMTRVRQVAEYASFEEMLDHEDARSIGGELGESREGLLGVIRGIYPPERERLGVLAIEVERIA